MSNHLAEYQSIQDQIRVLQERATLLVMEGRAEAVASIKSMIGIYTITAAEIGLVARAPARQRKREKSSNPRPAKYVDPVSGDTWTGQGREPKWLEGQERDAFLVNKPVQAAAPDLIVWPEHLRVAGADPVRGPE